MPAYSLARPTETRSTTRVLFLRKDEETIQFLSTAQETRYACSEMIFSLAPGARPPHAHEHMHQSETVEVLSGTMCLNVGGHRRMLGTGATFTIPAGRTHSFWNASKEERLIVKVSFSPSRNIEWYFTQMACSAIRNGGSWESIPLLEAATIHYALRNEFRLAYWPDVLQDLFFGTLTLIAKITGAVKNIRPMSLHTAYVK